MNRGDVVLVDLPRPQGQQATEQFGTRPAIILQDMSQYTNLSTAVIVPATSNPNAANFGGSFIVSPSRVNGLSCNSTLLVHQVRAIDKQRIRRTIGRLSTDDLGILENAIRTLLLL